MTFFVILGSLSYHRLSWTVKLDKKKSLMTRSASSKLGNWLGEALSLHRQFIYLLKRLSREARQEEKLNDLARLPSSKEK